VEVKLKKSILSKAWCAKYLSIVEWLIGITAQIVFKVHVIVALRVLEKELTLYKVCQNY